MAFLNLLSNYRKYLQILFPEILGCIVNKELILIIPYNKLNNFFKFLKNHTHSQFKLLTDLTSIDYPGKKNRFEIVYSLISTKYNTRLTIISCIDEITSINSSIKYYKCSNWFEREVWDMFGVFFENNQDLRRILTDYGFKGHPLRKDFPLTGYVEVRYDDVEKRVITEKVSLTQDYRDFTFTSNWLT